ncbi:helix-turn-helix transcriptional regulator [Paenibacillus cymbidii]|uniref:helix-turn-helix transcriptional regulator n=1 Tax=Paenibacillus cymbidii TaxID=1639034 RepID=UPI001081581F|nr:helix-turn-helix domain-containing protein [Paenibacillus cymbidii]
MAEKDQDTGETLAMTVAFAVAGAVEYRPGGTFGPRVQVHIQLVLVHTGRAKIWVNDTSYIVPQGHVALLLPGATERFEFAHDQSTWHRYIHVRVSVLPTATRMALEALPPFIPLSDRINQLTDLVLSLGGRDLAPAERELLCALGRSAVLAYAAECGSRESVMRQHPAVQLAKKAVADRYGDSLALADLAEAANVSPEHLIRLFQRETKMTPTQYLWRFRVERSVELLRSTGLTVGEIANRSGFKSTYHFARTIKRLTGMTPTELRRHSWEAGS